MPSVQQLENPQKDGILTKHGGKGIKSNWSKRWFVLKDDNLYYFKDKNDAKELHTISLKQYNKVEEGAKGKKNGFRLETSNNQDRVFLIYADNPQDMKAWIDALSLAIKNATGSASEGSSSSTSSKPETPVATTPSVDPSVPATPSSVPATPTLAPTGSKFFTNKICTLYMNVAEGRNLPPCDMISGLCDPYVIGDVAGSQVRTRTIFKSLNPFFGEDFHMEVQGVTDTTQVKFTVWDDDRLTKNTLIGQIVVPISSLKDGKIHEQWYPIFPADYESYVSGDLNLQILHKPNDKQIKIKVVGGRSLASKDANGLSDPYVQINFNGKKYKTQVVKKTLNPTFNEEFVIDVPDRFYQAQEGERTEGKGDLISIACWDWDAVGTNEFMGEILLRVHELEPDVETDFWYILTPKSNLSESESGKEEGSDSPSNNKSTGEIRLKLKYTEDVALPVDAYQPIYDLLRSPEEGPKVALLLETAVGASERGELASSLVRATMSALSPSLSLSLLSSLAKQEILLTQHAETIFRGNSLATKGIDAYMKATALPYLRTVLGPCIKKVFEYKKSCEVDPTREKEENIPGNFKRLLKFVNEITTAIFASASECPRGLRDLFAALQATATGKWGEDTVARYSAVSSFLFLRHICPALLNPKLFDLVADHADQKTARVLTLLSKTIQNLANLVEFGQKEPYMLKMNEFILENKSKMQAFLNEIAKPEGEAPVVEEEKDERKIVKRSAALFRYFDKSLPALKTSETGHEQQPLIRKIIAATETIQSQFPK